MNDVSLQNVWPEWQIESQIGKGSYGVVYKAVRKDNNVESYSAIKIITIPSDTSEIDTLRSEGLDLDSTKKYLQGVVDDFIGEIQLMESLKGIQNIVSVEDYKVIPKTDTVGWDIYIRMELLTSFNTYVTDKKLTEKEIIKLGCDICTALEICKQRNIIHRDIKPENIFINDFGNFKLGDFGIARKMENMTGGLSQKGTFNYMAPEVINSSKYDERADIYSLGIVLYKLLNANRLPFLENDQQLLNPNERRKAVERRIHGEALPAPCNAGADLAKVILCACAFEPDGRFSTASEFKKALEDVAAGVPIVFDAFDDKTVKVRKAPEDNLDMTVPVRKAPKETEKRRNKVESFDTKKKSKTPQIIVILLIIAILIGVAAFAAVKLLGNDSKKKGPSVNTGASATETSKPTEVPEDFTDKDKKKIDSIIKSAEQYASDEFYKSALEIIDDGLKQYPDSAELKAKQAEYTELLEKQVSQKILPILEEAEGYAELKNYKEAVSTIESGLKTYPNSNELTEKLDEYTKLLNEQEVNKIIETAETYSERKDYSSAIDKIEDGLELYPTSTALAEKLDEYKALLNEANRQKISAILEDAKAYADEEYYEDAIDVIEKGLKTYPDSDDLKTKLDEYNRLLDNQIETRILADAAELSEDGDYLGAMQKIKNAQTTYGDSRVYKSAYREYEVLYISSVISKADTYLAESKYDEAVNALNEAKLNVSDSKEIEDKLDDIAELKPTKLNEMFVIESCDYSYHNEQLIDSYGYSHTSYYYFDWNNPYAIYNLDKAYTNFKGSIVATPTSEYEQTLNIYLDGELAFTTSTNKFMTQVDFNLDVKGVTVLKIAILDGSREHARVAIVDAYLTKE